MKMTRTLEIETYYPKRKNPNYIIEYKLLIPIKIIWINKTKYLVLLTIK